MVFPRENLGGRGFPPQPTNIQNWFKGYYISYDKKYPKIIYQIETMPHVEKNIYLCLTKYQRYLIPKKIPHAIFLKRLHPN